MKLQPGSSGGGEAKGRSTGKQVIGGPEQTPGRINSRSGRQMRERKKQQPGGSTGDGEAESATWTFSISHGH